MWGNNRTSLALGVRANSLDRPNQGSIMNFEDLFDELMDFETNVSLVLVQRSESYSELSKY